MAAKCDRKNPLTRSGTQQDERYLPALEPGYFAVDERSAADLIAFAARYGRHLQYYDGTNTAAGNWESFFTTDVAAILTGLSKLPVTAFQTFARSLQDWLAEDATRDPAQLRSHFKLLFHLPLMLLADAGEHYDRLPRQHPLRGFMLNVLDRDLTSPLEALVAYFKGSLVLDQPPINDMALLEDTPLALGDYNTTFDDADPRIQLPSVMTERVDGAPAVSALTVGVGDFVPLHGGWAAFYGGVDADTTPYEDSIGASNQVYHQIYDALNYNLLDTPFERLFQALERIAQEAGRELQASLTAFDEHTPHYGLWLAFLRLFRFNQQDLNRLTQRHLSYYYEDVLRLCRQGAVPDHVHLLFTPNKNVEEHPLTAGTRFRGGKDATGTPVAYELDYDFVVNRSSVQSLMAVYRPTVETDSGEFVLPYASPVANSRDGEGEELSKDDPQWPPFGPAETAQYARIGFAVADRQLFLREGNRTIELRFESSTAVSGTNFSASFKASLTTEEGWLEIVGAPDLSVEQDPAGFWAFTVELNGEHPGIVPYNSAVHGGDYGVVDPMVKIEFDLPADQAEAAEQFSALADLQYDTLELQVTVTGVRNFTLQNEAGVIDSSKPFLPFGPLPAKNSPLILGSSELFSKELVSVTLNIDWEQALNENDFFTTTGPGSHKVGLRHLAEGKWMGAANTYDTQIFTSSGTGKEVVFTSLSDLSTSVPQTLENELYSPMSRSGFIRLELQQGFKHQAYVDEKTKVLIDMAGGDNAPQDTTNYNYRGDGLPEEPFTPKINEMSLSYATQLEAVAHFLQLHPFGFTKESSASGRLLPELSYEGELYIGVADLDPPQRLSLLFLVVDGTANPLKGEASLQWHYLQGNQWVAFDEQEVDDKTDNLSGSGIVGLAVPEAADTEHTRLPSGWRWFRMALERDTDAVNNLLTIDAQAAIATFVDQGNDPGFLVEPLAPGTISKLEVSDPAIKKISQPHASFGGQPAESDDAFAVRSSEHLRHKDRAVSMWDYEHLILEAFPNVYKVRSINHTELVRDVDNNILADNEVRPGHVLVVPIPYVDPETALNPLRPYADLRTRAAIDAFLRRRLSPFVQLEVQNPKFEEVQVKFKVAFTPDIADIAFYQDELNLAIRRFLSPWAYDEGAEISFGGKWHKSAIIDFVEERSYVDYVTDFEMYHKPDISLVDAAWSKVDEEVVEATTSRSILVSHPEHDIDEAVGNGC